MADKHVRSFVFALFFLASFAPHAHAQMEHMLTIVDTDRVLIGSEFIPRRADLPSKLIVPPGATVELDATSTFDYIEVAGTLRASRTHNTTLTFTHLIVLPGGVLDVGTQSDPIPCDVKVLFNIRSVPIDTTIDPYQWGNGLVNFGRQTRVGCAKTAFLPATGSLPAGAQTVTLASAPSGWAVGDELLLPDTAEPTLNAQASALVPARREPTITIAGMNGGTVVLSRPLTFAHNDQTDPNGAVLLHPRVANLTRNIVIQ